MKKGFIVMLALAVVAMMTGSALALSITQSKHNLSQPSTNWIKATSNTNSGAEICVFCHSPHASTTPNMTIPLWNHAETTVTFSLYTSSSFDGSATQTQPSGATKACLSCHDGVTAVNDLINNAGSGAIADPAMQNLTAGNALPATLTTYVGNNLVKTHPVSFVYNNALVTADGGGLYQPASTNVPAGWLGGTGSIEFRALFGTAGNKTMECASCHDVHDNVNGRFLKLNNNGSALCLVCHNK